MAYKKVYKPLKDLKLIIDRKTNIPNVALTEKQLELLSVMHNYYQKYGTPPSLRKCAAILGIKHLPVYDRLRGLVKLGYVFRNGFTRSYVPSAGAIYLIVKGFVTLKEYDI